MSDSINGARSQARRRAMSDGLIFGLFILGVFAIGVVAGLAFSMLSIIRARISEKDDNGSR